MFIKIVWKNGRSASYQGCLDGPLLQQSTAIIILSIRRHACL